MEELETPQRVATSADRPRADTGAVVQFAVGCALAAWCYGRVLARDLEWWRGTLSILLLPVLVWAAARLAAVHWPWPDGEETAPTRPALRLPTWVGLAALTALALTVSIG